jgi:redox-sensitive bicupin YhaK (pirin superfamily)
MTAMWSVRRVDTTPPPAPGFIGEGHTAVEIVTPTRLADSDPFVVLMDDRLDIPRRRMIGGPHPHAGLETVTLVLEGTLHDRDEGELRAGDVLWMNAGGGIVHNEAVEAEGRSRVLQLWVALRGRDRRADPGFELVRRETAPALGAPGLEGRLYSGALLGARSPTRNRVPVTMADLTVRAGAVATLDPDPTYNGFAYVLDGAARLGGTLVRAGQVAWLQAAPGGLEAAAVDGDARLVLYVGEPIREPLVHRGPFVAGSPAELASYYEQFRAGRFPGIGEVGRRQRAAATRT